MNAFEIIATLGNAAQYSRIISSPVHYFTEVRTINLQYRVTGILKLMKVSHFAYTVTNLLKSPATCSYVEVCKYITHGPPYSVKLVLGPI